MGWYSIDAVDGAFHRTRHALFEPFDFWKWLKLGIIIFFIGGSGGSPNFSGSGQNYGGEDFTGGPSPTFDEMISQVGQFWHLYMIYILIGMAFFFGIILLLGYISNVMEFVLVDSLVTNSVTFWAYTRKYLGPGLNLFIIRFALGILFLLLMLAAMLPVILPFINLTGEPDMGLLFGGILWILVVIFILAVVSGIIQSFINLSIPLAMYHNTGIIAAFRKVFANFRADWKQIIVYWIVRFFLGIIAGIAVGIAAFILFLLVFGFIFVIGLLIYLVLSGLGLGIDDIFLWAVMIPFGLVVMVLFMIFVLMASVPVPVFMKYHMLTFLKSWYPDAGIPFTGSETPK